MGRYVNPGIRNMKIDINDEFYVDKSMLIALLNEKIETMDRFICVSRPRRFGKTMAANMIAAYYSKGCDSHEIFADLKISKDPSFEEYINKYTVIKLDLNGAITNGQGLSIAQYYDRNVVPELIELYPDVDFSDIKTLTDALIKINAATRDRFVFIIDEYDIPFREEEYLSELKDYYRFLVSLFKSSVTNQTIALAYLTGILPIIKDKTQSGLNNFTEYTMVDAFRMAPFMGFTEDEVKSLATQSGMEFDELKKWYDGYNLEGEKIYSPKSIIDAVTDRKCDGYWTQTCSYEVLMDRLILDFKGMKSDVIAMISGKEIPVNVKKFTNSIEINSKDDVFTSIIHLGYLGYNYNEKTCFIPNNEIKDMWVLTMERTKGYKDVFRIIKDSKKLLKSIWNGDEEVVAEGVSRAHMEACSILEYNNEGSFQSAIHLAYYYASSYYTIINELPAGKGFADCAFIPYKPDVPAIIIELKKDDSVENAIDQIKERKYPEALEKYKDNLLLVAISYDSKTKEHRCKIEKTK